MTRRCLKRQAMFRASFTMRVLTSRVLSRTLLLGILTGAMSVGVSTTATGVVLRDPPASAPTQADEVKGAAQEAPKASAKDASQDKPTPPQPRSLDDLLGVPESPASSSSAEDAARREQAKRLERSLDEASMEDLAHRAVDGMRNAADRLTDAKDAGVGTQRIQEDVVRTLDRLLEEAQKQKGKKSSSSKKKQSGKKDGKQDPSEKNGQQQKQQQKKPTGASTGNDSQSEVEKSDSRDDAVVDGQELSESRIEWGQLPERVRELVLQGRRDRVSTIYERLTREYYRRLAEEASR